MQRANPTTFARKPTKRSRITALLGIPHQCRVAAKPRAPSARAVCSLRRLHQVQSAHVHAAGRLPFLGVEFVLAHLLHDARRERPCSGFVGSHHGVLGNAGVCAPSLSRLVLCSLRNNARRRVVGQRNLRRRFASNLRDVLRPSPCLFASLHRGLHDLCHRPTEREGRPARGHTGNLAGIPCQATRRSDGLGSRLRNFCGLEASSDGHLGCRVPSGKSNVVAVAPRRSRRVRRRRGHVFQREPECNGGKRSGMPCRLGDFFRRAACCLDGFRRILPSHGHLHARPDTPPRNGQSDGQEHVRWGPSRCLRLLSHEPRGLVHQAACGEHRPRGSQSSGQCDVGVGSPRHPCRHRCRIRDRRH
mmetsp:Transcript_49795/g.139356  ORF Transcript_49795/g.139356 Transcript_49795/m.139356 type:complete len:360 (+) Transcript_49795:60-1139(+)